MTKALGLAVLAGVVATPGAAHADPARASLELATSVGVSVDDSLIEHRQLGVRADGFVTERLAIGFELDRYDDQLREPYDLVARQARRQVQLSRCRDGAAIDLRFVAAAGDASWFGQRSLGWRAALVAGLGFTRTEAITRDPALRSPTRVDLTTSVGLTGQTLLADGVALELGARDYLLPETLTSDALVIQAGLSVRLAP